MQSMTVETGSRNESQEDESGEYVCKKQNVSLVHNNWLLYESWQAWNSICMSYAQKDATNTLNWTK